jgi:hypothetical protein
MGSKNHWLIKMAAVYGALFSLLLLGAQSGGAQENRIVHFTMFLKNDAVVRLDSREKRLNIEKSAFDIIVYEKTGDRFRKVRKMQWPEITRSIYAIDLVNANRSTYSKAKLLITRQDGTQEVFQYGSLYRPEGDLVNAFFYSEYNRVAGRWTRQRVPLESVEKLVFGSNRLMVNPETGDLYPPDYRYDPHTGTPLAESALKEG